MDANDPWIQRVWKYLATTMYFSEFIHLSLLPAEVSESRSNALMPRATVKNIVTLLPLNGIYILKSLAGIGSLCSSLASALTTLGVRVLEKVPSYVTQHRQVMGSFVNYPSTDGVLAVIKRISDDSELRSKAIRTFNATASEEAKMALVDLLCSVGNTSGSAHSLMLKLQLFRVAFTRKSASIYEVPHIGPVNLPPISPPVQLLACNSAERNAAVVLGATERTLQEVVYDIMQQISGRCGQYTTEEVVKFMTYFMNNWSLMEDPSLLSMSRSVKFVRTGSGQIMRAGDVYDPSSPLLQELFLWNRSAFPHGEFTKPDMLKKLRKLGLRAEKDVTADDLVRTASTISNMLLTNQQIARRLSEGLLRYLTVHGASISGTTLSIISDIQCLPCLQDGEKPSHYPSSMPIRSVPCIVRPREMASFSQISLIGSTVPVCRPGTVEGLPQLCMVQEVAPDNVLQHLRQLTQHFRQGEASQYKLLLGEIFHHLKQYTFHSHVTLTLQQENCVLVESGDRFARPASFWVHRRVNDIDLKPYRFAMPVEMMGASDLMEQCGSSYTQDDQMLRSILGEIQHKHSYKTSPDFHVDFQLVKQILDVLGGGETAHTGATLIPVALGQQRVLKFMAAEECTVLPGMKATDTPPDAGFEVHYVHPDIPVNTALNLGAKLMNDRALTGVEGLDYGYSQHEDLTSRLHGLLSESYTDGFSVPKELIQNADDAGASKVCFMLDERENENFRTNLIADSMSSLQGPAIWAYNDAIFSESDFENIVKLGAGTKKDDTSKVGRFGLGFNAVYNLTDVPCFLSGNKLAMFDPQNRYLYKGAGLQLDFVKPINRALLDTKPQQFQPYQNVFGCTLKGSKDTYYKGTLFRFPLRTTDQAINNKLKSESYSMSKRREFLKMILEKAGSLLMFTQSVKQIEVFYLPSHCSDPTDRMCLLTVTKIIESTHIICPQVQLSNRTILQFMKDNWSRKSTDIRITQNIVVEVSVSAEANDVCGVQEKQNTLRWALAWASGVDSSAELACTRKHEGLVPLACVAISLSQNGILMLKDNPAGFYSSGHLFCFLPLPEELSQVDLPVHINATFALTSDRRGLFVKTEDDLDSGGALWNKELYGDAVSRAYMVLLELIRQKTSVTGDFTEYFDLWPRKSVPCLADSFYRKLSSSSTKLLPVPGKSTWVAFSEARFLHPQFRDSSWGKIAWSALQRFWKGPGFLVDVPSDVCKLMEEKGPSGSFSAKVITELAFYKDFFFPHLNSDWWQAEDRDRLVCHALMMNNKEIDELIKAHACIPCEGVAVLKKPSQLISPKGRVSKLYLSAEGCFPQDGTGKPGESMVSCKRVDFCQKKTLERLSELGMLTDEMPWALLVSRAKSVGQLNDEQRTGEAVSRASYLIEYLSFARDADSMFSLQQCPPDLKQELSQTAFLPVLSKPTDWPFPWAGAAATGSVMLAAPTELFSNSLKRLVAYTKKVLVPWAGAAATGSVMLAAPTELFSDSLKRLVACTKKVLDSKALTRSAAQTEKWRETLRALGLLTEVNYSDATLLHSALEQLSIVAQHHNRDSSSGDLVQSISGEIYAFLHRCLQRNEDDVQMKMKIHTHLNKAESVWTGTKFVQPSLVAFSCPFDCSPYLFKLEKSLSKYQLCFEVAGVKSMFDESVVLSALENIKRAHDGIRLSFADIGLVSRLAQLLGEIFAASSQAESLDKHRIFLPDGDGFMHPAGDLCVEDSNWCIESGRMKFVHESIPTGTAFVLGVNTKRRQHLKLFTRPIHANPFGQHEKLTTRIRRLLQSYTFDSSLCKELIQNADDAGATECRFIMDFRHLATDEIPDGWAPLQGPALCFYNNKSFTTDDMKGIQDLGVGSKEQEVLKIGQFGVGFNAVYHITDVPSFWTKVDDKQDVFCAFDPNCLYVPGATPDSPGIEFTNIEEQQVYRDFLSGYLNNAIDMTTPGTLFRFPLRTDSMAETSEISKSVVSESDIQQLLDKFREEISASLLFLNNLCTVGIYSVREDGSLEQHFQVSKAVEECSRQHLCNFRSSLQHASQVIKQASTKVQDISASDAVVLCTMENSLGNREEWLTVHRLGFCSDTELSPKVIEEWGNESFKPLPLGGVAVCLKAGTNRNRDKPPCARKHQAFCTLPLPVFTNLPFHVNGHFALSHEARRGLWDDKAYRSDIRSEWNDSIALKVIVPAYITALKEIKHVLFSSRAKDFSENLMNSTMKQYHDLFPDTDGSKSDLWARLVDEIYKTLADNELALFPVMQKDESEMEWMPAVKRNGFPGYFSNLENIFKNQQANKPVRLTQGTSAFSQGGTVSPSPKDRAIQLLLLLKRVNMKILGAPFRIYESFRASGVKEMRDVTSSSVLHFLKSSGQFTGDACSINGLPKPVANTPLQTPENVIKLVKFIRKDQEFLDNLVGLPLCLRQSEMLHTFSTEERTKPIKSKFCHLLPGSAEDFLHAKMIGFFPSSEKTANVFQELTIPKLASILQNTLTDPCFRAGSPCVLELNKLPSVSSHTFWLRDLWEFIDSQLKSKDSPPLLAENSMSDSVHEQASPLQTEGKEQLDDNKLRQKADVMLQDLRNWNLIPVKKKAERREGEKSLLYPINDLHHVVHISFNPDLTNIGLWNILKELPLPFLDAVSLPAMCSTTKLVASISHPKALLTALASSADKIKLSSEHGQTVLDYFTKALAVLEELFVNKEELKKALRSLPVYPAIDGSSVSLSRTDTVLCLKKAVPTIGLMEWSFNQSCSTCLLKAEYVPEDLASYLGCKRLTKEDFYSQYLLPTLVYLPRKAILRHMTFLRNSFSYGFNMEKDAEVQLLHQLKLTAFIIVDDILCTAGDFFSPHVRVFRNMCSRAQFPPEPFCDCEWKSFMIAAGMISEVTPEKFVEYARTVENLGRQQITKETCEKSLALIDHLFDKEDLTQGWLLQSVKDIQFVLPSRWSSTPEGKQLSRIVPPLCSSHLICYSESSFEQHHHLLWSSCCLLDPKSDPRKKYYHNNDKKWILHQLGLQEEAPKEKVLQHVQNISWALAGESGQELFASFPQRGNQLVNAMVEIYTYLEQNHAVRDKAVLEGVPLICDIENCQMLKPANVVIDLRQNEMIEGHIEKAPVEFGRHFELFKKLGASQSVSANHYALVLTWLKEETQNNQLHVEELKIVKRAIEGLFRCLREGSSEQRRIDVSHLYLPTENKLLLRSTEIIYKDGVFGSRLQYGPEEMHFFLGFKMLEIQVSTPLEDVRLLPVQHQMVMLSDMVQEIIPDYIRDRATEGDCSRDLMAVFQTPNVKSAIIRLAYHQYHISQQPFTNEIAADFLNKLSHVSIMEVVDLKTTLTRNDQPVDGTEMSKPSFTHEIEGNQRQAIIYVDTVKGKLTGSAKDPALLSLVCAIRFVLQVDLNECYLLISMLYPAEAKKTLDDAGVSVCDFSSLIEESVFPAAGTYIPEHQHCYLDNSFYKFSKGEHAGYEVYDPDVENEQSEDTDAQYVFAIIIEEVCTQGEDHSPMLARRYRIYLGPDHGEIEVSATELYKFFRRRRQHMSTAVVEYEGETAAEETAHPQDMNTVLREIRKMLTDAWQQLPEDRARRRVVKRLVLKWHPDKNHGNEEFCTKVTQKIYQYADLLEQGKPLPENDDYFDDVDGSTYSSGSTFSSAFRDRMNARARNDRYYYDSHSGSGGDHFGSGPNPQPSEGRRWLRQAQADVAAAHAAWSTYDRGYNWICYQCHQVGLNPHYSLCLCGFY